MILTPDGYRYKAMSLGRVARPFHYRWLLPRLCSTSNRRWQAASYTTAVMFCALVGVYTGSWWAVALPAGCAGAIRVNIKNPVLVDLPAMTLALASAVCVQQHLWLLAIAFACIAGMTKETAPVFAALYAWHPIGLVGLLPVAIRHLQRPGPDVLDTENRWILEHPIRASWKYHKPLPAWAWVLPWGACLAGLGSPSWPLAATLAVAYAQCVLATDTVRLYQWALPALAVAAVDTVPARWWPVLIAVHLTNPFRTDGF